MNKRSYRRNHSKRNNVKLNRIKKRAISSMKQSLKAYLPIINEMMDFKDFVKKAIKKNDARPFKVSENITMMVIDSTNGKKANFGSKETIIESFKKNNVNLMNNKFNDISDRLKNNNILRFY